MSAWIKRSEREPVEADYPIMAGRSTDMGWTETCYQGTMWKGCAATHWRSIKCDPPPRELTQRERDEATVLNLRQRLGTTADRDCLDAIYAERREVLRILQGGAGEARADYGLTDYWCKQARELRVRLDEQGAK